MAITAKYDWYGKTNTVQLTPHNYGHRFEHDGAKYQIERDAQRNHKWNVYRVTWNGDGARLAPVVQLAASRKQAIADTVLKAIVDSIEAEDALEEPAGALPDADHVSPQADAINVTDLTITREDAEQVQLKAHGLAGATDLTEAGPSPAPEPTPLPVTWEQALAEAKEKGVGRCSDHAAMAAFCDASITYAVGAVSGQLIWEGAMRKGLSFLQLGRLAGRDPIACAELMWV